MSAFVCKEDLCVVILAYAYPSVGMPQENSCAKGKCLSPSALKKIRKCLKIL